MKRHRFFLAAALVISSLISWPIYANKEKSLSLNQLLAQRIRPTLTQVLISFEHTMGESLTGDIKYDKDLIRKYLETENTSTMDTNALSTLIVAFESIYNGGTLLTLGRDSVLVGDYINAYGLIYENRIRSYNIPYSTPSAGSEHLIPEYLRQQGLNYNAPILIYDRTRLRDASQTTVILKTLYNHLATNRVHADFDSYPFKYLGVFNHTYSGQRRDREVYMKNYNDLVQYTMATQISNPMTVRIDTVVDTPPWNNRFVQLTQTASGQVVPNLEVPAANEWDTNSRRTIIADMLVAYSLLANPNTKALINKTATNLGSPFQMPEISESLSRSGNDIDYLFRLFAIHVRFNSTYMSYRIPNFDDPDGQEVISVLDYAKKNSIQLDDRFITLLKKSIIESWNGPFSNETALTRWNDGTYRATRSESKKLPNYIKSLNTFFEGQLYLLFKDEALDPALKNLLAPPKPIEVPSLPAQEIADQQPEKPTQVKKNSSDKTNKAISNKIETELREITFRYYTELAKNASLARFIPDIGSPLQFKSLFEAGIYLESLSGYDEDKLDKMKKPIQSIQLKDVVNWVSRNLIESGDELVSRAVTILKLLEHVSARHDLLRTRDERQIIAIIFLVLTQNSTHEQILSSGIMRSSYVMKRLNKVLSDLKKDDFEMNVAEMSPSEPVAKQNQIYMNALLAKSDLMLKQLRDLVEKSQRGDACELQL